MSLVSELPAVRKAKPKAKANVHPKLFKEAMAAIPSAVTIITTWNGDGTPAGATLSGHGTGLLLGVAGKFSLSKGADRPLVGMVLCSGMA